MDRLGEHYNRYSRINTDESNKTNYASNDFKDAFSSNFNKQLSVSNEPDITYTEYENYLVVSSGDRDVNLYPKSNNFMINLDEEYRNISRIELIQAIVPDKNNVTSEPYLLLKIKELDNTMQSNNKAVFESFAILQVCSPTVSGSFLQMDKRIYENTILNYKTPKATLSKLTITINDANGIPFEFGGDGTTNKAYQSLFVFRVVTLETNRQSINTRNLY